MIFYNEKRPHAKNRYKTPAKRELEFFSKQANKSDNLYYTNGFRFIVFYLLIFYFELFRFIYPISIEHIKA